MLELGELDCNFLLAVLVDFLEAALIDLEEPCQHGVLHSQHRLPSGSRSILFWAYLHGLQKIERMPAEEGELLVVLELICLSLYDAPEDFVQ